MRTAIVYEGTHGSSAAVARIIAAEAAVHGPVIVGEVHEIPLSELEGVEFLVVGGPTHHWEDWADVSRTPSAAHVLRDFRPTTDGVRSWLDHLPPRPSFSAATFDTREAGLRVLTGTAALSLYRALRRRGCHLVTRPVSFLVKPGPVAQLLDGESERVSAWAVQVFRRAEHHHPVHAG
ncbi:MAG: flavodoxin family protein [Candidatus Dormibacteria bacterium]